MTTCLHHSAAIDGRSNKIAAPGVSFWLLNLVAVMVAGSLGQPIAQRVGDFASLSIALLCLVGMLGLQISGRRFIAAVYWLTIIAVTLASSLLTDLIDSGSGLVVPAGVAVLSGLTVAVFAAWQMIGSGVRLFPVMRRQTEIFYWLAALASSASGFVFADLLDDRFGLGTVNAGIFIGVLLAGACMLARGSRRASVLGAWAVFALIRPVGVAAASVLARLPANSGLTLGAPTRSLLLSGLMVVLLLILYRKEWQQHL